MEKAEMYQIPFDEEGYSSFNGNVSRGSSRSFIPVVKRGGERFFVESTLSSSYSGANGSSAKKLGELTRLLPVVKKTEISFPDRNGADFACSGYRDIPEQALFVQHDEQKWWGSGSTKLLWTGEPLPQKLADMFGKLYTPGKPGVPHKINLGWHQWDVNKVSNSQWNCEALKSFCRETDWAKWSLDTWFEVFEVAYKANFGEFLKFRVVTCESYKSSMGGWTATQIHPHDESLWAIWSQCDRDPETFKNFWKNRPSKAELAKIFEAAVAKHGYKAVKSALMRRKSLKEIMSMSSAWMHIVHNSAEFTPLQSVKLLLAKAA